MKSLLISPSVHKSGIKKIRPFWLPPLGLASLAGLFPKEWEVRLVDENVEDIDFDEKADLVGIGFMTANSSRAYEIGRQFKKRGRKVILGGPHMTVMPNEGMPYADTIIVGDAETVWPRVLKDYHLNKLGQKYIASQNPKGINSFSKPRRDLYKKDAYLSVNSIQTSRGCPFQCSFCSIASRYHGRYGKKEVKEVIREVEKLEDKKIPIFFVDDNIFADKRRGIELCKCLKEIKVRWWSQADITIARDEKVLDLLKESGCIKLVVGFESLSEGSIQSVNKKQNNIYEYGKFIKTMHEHGILVNTSFAFGADYDHEDVFENTYQFLNDNNVIFATFNILTPLPGTELFIQMKKSKRLDDSDWSHYDMGHPVFEPKNFSKKFLKEGYDWICKEFYSLQHIYKRINKIKSRKDIFDINLILAWNLGYKKMLDTFGVFM